MAKLLLIGNHTCANRGDGAILRGLAEHLERTRPGDTLTITSRFPEASAYLLGRPVERDRFTSIWRLAAGPAGRGTRRMLPRLLAMHARGLPVPLPGVVRRAIAEIAEHDLVIQVGGSFFVDKYGARQLETPLAALIARRPLLMIGHSMGPLTGRAYRALMRTMIGGAAAVALRERISETMLRDAGMPMEKVRLGADTAWLVDASETAAAPDIVSRFADPGKPVVAFTLRNLAPFDQRLGVSQEDYEQAVASLMNALAARGYNILAASTCTGLGGYPNDDRLVAERLRPMIADPGAFHVLMDEIDDRQLGGVLGQCTLLVGTRLHSAIIAMNFGTPAIALNYEHKSRGILADMGLEDLAIDLPDVLSGRLLEVVNRALDRLPVLREKMAIAVTEQRRRAASMIDEMLQPYPTVQEAA